MNHYPLPFFKLRYSFLLPRVLLDQSFGVEALHAVRNLEAVGHCLELVKEGFFTCVFDEVNSRDLFVTSVIQLPDVHCDFCGKTTLNSQTQ